MCEKCKLWWLEKFVSGLSTDSLEASPVRYNKKKGKKNFFFGFVVF
jgi:hypothetical protein